MGRGKKLKSITIAGITFAVGDTVSLRPPDEDDPPFVARIYDLGEEKAEGLQVRVTWFYRPEEAHGGRKAFHGEKELFTSDHHDWVASSSINGKCHVHTLKAYEALHVVSEGDYFSRFLYKASAGEFKPDRVPVYCMCEMPYNPDLFMVQCEGCDEWIHPECMQLTKKEVEKMAHFVCPELGAGARVPYSTCTRKHLKPKVQPPASKKGKKSNKDEE